MIIGFNLPMSVNIFGDNWWNSSVSKYDWLHVDIFHGIANSKFDCILVLT